MHRTSQAAVVLTLATIVLLGGVEAQDFRANLSGFNEVPPIVSNGTGTVALVLDANLQSVNYSLTYSGLGASVAQGHLKFGQEGVSGGVIAFLCTNLGNGPPGTPACPSPSGTVTGTLTPASIIGPVAQNIAAGDFTSLVKVLNSERAYVNVSTSQFPAGELRGPLRSIISAQTPPAPPPVSAGVYHWAPSNSASGRNLSWEDR
jgi:hypothetical protein